VIGADVNQFHQFVLDSLPCSLVPATAIDVEFVGIHRTPSEAHPGSVVAIRREKPPADKTHVTTHHI